MPMRWPRTLFGRNVLLMVALTLLAQFATGLLFRQGVMVPRLHLAADATVHNVQAFAQALAALPADQRAAFVAHFNARTPDEGPASAARPSPAGAPLTRLEKAFLRHLDQRLPATAEGPRWRRGTDDSLVVRVDVDGRGYWLDLRGMLPPGDAAAAWAAASLTTALLAILGAWWLQRRLGRPLDRLVVGARALEHGHVAPRLAEDGPTEIATVSRAFNEMADGLARHARERELMLAGLSHDLRTPLAKMRLAVEMLGPGADASLVATLQRNVDAIDGLLTQFLAYTRATRPPDEPERELDLDALVAESLALCAPDGVVWLPGGAGVHPLRAQAVARVVTNLVVNAQKHGAPPVEVATGRDATTGAPWLEVRDRGPGIASERVEALKAPFARGDEARGGAAGGAGLGLAIVERIAQGEGARLVLAPRPGGGLLARVAFAARA